MRTRIRPLAVLLATLVLTAGSEQAASAAFSTEILQCRGAIQEAARNLSRSIINVQKHCHKVRATRSRDSSFNCNEVFSSKPWAQNKVAAAEDRLRAVALPGGQCFGLSPSDALYYSCPAPFAGLLADYTDVTGCIIHLARANAVAFSETTNGTPVWPLLPGDRECQSAIGKNGAKVYNVVLQNVTSCQNTSEQAGATTIDDCLTNNFPSPRVTIAIASASQSIATACANANFANLDSCGVTLSDVAACVPQAASDSSQEMAGQILQLGDASDTTSTTTTTLPPGPSQCPNLGEWTLYSRDSATSCASNDDCALPRVCDTGLGHCTTLTSLDYGWMGLLHGTDTNDGVRTRVRLSCPEDSAPGACGECTVTGIDPGGGNCRCSNDTRAICTNPFEADEACGGATCDCYPGAPLPLSSMGTPMCFVNRFSADLTGTVDVDTGSSQIAMASQVKVYLGISVFDPCPHCDGDTTAGDGSRDGTCSGGVNAGLSCDAQAVNATFPASPYGADGGGTYSLDCMPDLGKNVSGNGLPINETRGTGTSALTSGIDCDGAGPGTELCPCRACSTDGRVACSNDAECAPQGAICKNTRTACSADSDCADLDLGTCLSFKRCSLASTVQCASDADCKHRNQEPCNPSTCSSNGAGNYPHPNDCENGACTDFGGGYGECTTGPDDWTCDNLVRADGSGILPCFSDADCAEWILDPGATCTLSKRRPCFLDPIVATGAADSQFPVSAAAFCVPPTSSAAINSVTGLAGPGRAVQQTRLATFCASDNAVQYTPGVGGCP